MSSPCARNEQTCWWAAIVNRGFYQDLLRQNTARRNQPHGNPLFDFMDNHATKCGGSFPVFRSAPGKIFKWLRIAQDTGKGVRFLRHSRFGKSRAVRSYAQVDIFSVNIDLHERCVLPIFVD